MSIEVQQLVHQQETQDDPPTLQEVMEAVDKQKSGKAAGLDEIPAEVWKYGGEGGFVTLLTSCHRKSLSTSGKK